jgi:hypothetical protein
MRILSRPFFLLILLLCSRQTAQSQQIQLSDDKLQVNVEGRLGYFRDPEDSVDFSSILKTEFNTLSPDRVPTLGFDRASHWFRLEILNQSKHKEWLLEVGYAPLDLIECYFFNDSTGQWVVRKSGDVFPISSREIRHRHVLFPFYFNNHEAKTIYFRVKSNSSVQVPVFLWERLQFYKASYESQFRN